MFEVGGLASDELAAIAQNGDPGPMFTRFSGSKHVTQVVNVGRPLTRQGTTVGSFTDSATFEIEAAPGDRFSLATMLICTNDGFLGLDAVKLPKSGSATYLLNGWHLGNRRILRDVHDWFDPAARVMIERVG